MALNLGSYFRSHCTVTRLEGVMGGWLRSLTDPVSVLLTLREWF